MEPVIAGLDQKTNEPFIASLDLIGCPMVTEDFVVSGTCSEQMYGMCETLYRPNLVTVLYDITIHVFSVTCPLQTSLPYTYLQALWDIMTSCMVSWQSTWKLGPNEL